METGNNNLMNRLSRSVKRNKRGFSLLLLFAMVVSVVGGAIPMIDGLADNGGPYTNRKVGDGPGTITLNKISGERSPIWYKGSNKLSMANEGADAKDLLEDVDVSDVEADTPRRVLGGAEFSVRSLDEISGVENNIKEAMVTDTNGNFTLTGLPLGLYEVVETKAPVGYESLKGNSLVIELTGNDKHAHLVFENRELEVSPVITKEWTDGSEPVDFNIDYEYYGVNGDLVKEEDVLFRADTIEIGNVLYYTPKGDVNKVNVTNHSIDAKTDHQYVYELVEDGHNVKFLADQVKRHIVVKKDFDGQMAENVDVELVELDDEVENPNDLKVVGTITLSEKNNWAHTFKDMPRYTEEQLNESITERSGNQIKYGVREVEFESEADGYASHVRGDEINSFVIVNKELEDFDVVIDKVWVGTKGDQAKFEVKVDGEVWETVSMTSADKWTKTVPLKQVPYDAKVTVEEIDVDENYDINVIEGEDHKFTVESVERLGSLEILKNKGANNPSMSMVSVSRNEESNRSMFRMASINENLEDESSEEEEVQGPERTRLEGATFLLEGSDEDNEFKKEVTTGDIGLSVIADIPYGNYTLTEISSPDGYKIGDVDSINFTIDENQTRNKYRADFYNERSEIEAQDLDITVTKEWEFEKDVSGFEIPESVDMKLVSKLPNGEVHEESEVFTLSKENDWSKTFTGMSNVNNTNDYIELDYSVVEVNETDVDYDLYVVKTGSYFNNKGNEVEILATNVEALGMIDVITVEGDEKPTTDFKLENNIRVIDGAKFELRETDTNKLVRESSTSKDGRLTMVNLPYGDYTLTEIEAPKGYRTQEDNSIQITVDKPQTRDMVEVKFENEILDRSKIMIDVDVKADWKDHKGEDLDLVNVDEVKFELLRNDIEQDKFVTLNAKNDWKSSFEDLNKYIGDSEDEYEYTIKLVEDNNSPLSIGYTTDIIGDAKSGFVMVNTENKPVLVDIPVVKKWIGDSEELDKVTLQLKDEDEVVDEITLTAQTNWSGLFKDVEVTRFGGSEGVNHTLVELDHEGYTSRVLGKANQSGFEVSNTQITEDDSKNPIDPKETRDVEVKLSSKSVKLDKVKVHLLADGKTVDDVTLTKDNDYKHTFKNLKVIESENDKSTIKYTIKVDNVEGYKFDVSGDVVEGFTITAKEVVVDPSEKDKGKDPVDPSEKDKGKDPVDPSEKDKGETLTTAEMYNRINKDMTYEDVVKLIGKEGKKVEGDDVNKFKDAKTSEIYEWKFENGDLIMVGFDNNLATSKFATIGDKNYANMDLSKDTKDPQAGTPNAGAPNAGTPQGGAAPVSGGFKQTATSAIGLGLFAAAGLAGVGAVVYKKKKED